MAPPFALLLLLTELLIKLVGPLNVIVEAAVELSYIAPPEAPDVELLLKLVGPLKVKTLFPEVPYKPIAPPPLALELLLKLTSPSKFIVPLLSVTGLSLAAAAGRLLSRKVRPPAPPALMFNTLVAEPK
ncbi:hypothetical protein FHW67_000365 [Herbaspirillum sp. Sphag1AN]|uniref:hypothetical protein n=1 Tax=unclassified Herbaspirillum TaxID=2624150 RepID=UPI00184D872E|nr:MULTISPECIES: hypothetical protein [unclassified Herbaspirillum]MBB3211130.1 hypothetical protein [Herbaspirillum sp. Sphag1AN]MBB3244759.1 hypothetical protein [Herbaspirillum sp. Sphag64]